MNPKEQANQNLKHETELQPEEKMLEVEDFNQGEKEKDRVRFVEKRLEELVNTRNQGFKYFGMKNQNTNKQEYLTLIDYINESEKRLNGDLPKPEHKDDWQANIFDNITRDKFISIISRLSAQRMKAQFLNNEGLPSDTAKIVTNLYEAAARGKNGLGKDEKFLFKSLFEAGAKGTVVREETYFLGKRKIKDHEHFRKTEELKFKTIYEYEDVYSKVIPLEEFYPGDITKQDIQEMPDCAVVQFPDYATFRQEFADYENAKYVQKGTISKEEQALFNIDSTKEEVVRVVKYYNRITDSHDIVAGGVLLTKVGNPLPHPHKQLPFNAGMFEMISPQFFYGMSLPMKLASMQDMNNSLLNMTFDQLYIALMTPIFNSSGADIDIDWLYPKAVIDLPRGTNPNAIRELNTNPNNITLAQNAMAIIKRRMDEGAASGSEQSGISGAGRSKTAEEVATAREAAMEISGMFLRFMEWSEEDRAEQRIQNMLYYYSKPLKSNGKYRKIVVDNVRLLQGELGKMMVNITKEPRKKEELDKINLQTEEMSQVVDVTPELLRNFNYMVKIVPNASLKDTESTRINKELSWYQITAQDPMFNQKEVRKDLAEAFGKDISKIMAVEQPAQTPIPGMEGMPTPPVSPIPASAGAQKEIKPSFL